jgi:hypothetical protein
MKKKPLPAFYISSFCWHKEADLIINFACICLKQVNACNDVDIESTVCSSNSSVCGLFQLKVFLPLD